MIVSDHTLITNGHSEVRMLPLTLAIPSSALSFVKAKGFKFPYVLKSNNLSLHFM